MAWNLFVRVSKGFERRSSYPFSLFPEHPISWYELETIQERADRQERGASRLTPSLWIGLGIDKSKAQGRAKDQLFSQAGMKMKLTTRRERKSPSSRLFNSLLPWVRNCFHLAFSKPQMYLPPNALLDDHSRDPQRKLGASHTQSLPCEPF